MNKMNIFVGLLYLKNIYRFGLAGFIGLFYTCPYMHASSESSDKTATAIFAGGCFWCTEAAFDHVPGVIKTTSGYTGGHLDKPTYGDVSSGSSGHYEALKVTYDPSKVSYNQLLDIFWESIDPTDAGGQFADRGSQYKTAIFYLNEDQYQAALQSKKQVEQKLGMKVQTAILKASTFYPAEEAHQDYHQKNPMQYQYYKRGSGRPQRLQELWGE
ncbi:MAG: peptide-methionine (S)-S-oxide reductase MsrA [Opitutales bacterium]